MSQSLLKLTRKQLRTYLTNRNCQGYRPSYPRSLARRHAPRTNVIPGTAHCALICLRPSRRATIETVLFWLKRFPNHGAPRPKIVAIPIQSNPIQSCLAIVFGECLRHGIVHWVATLFSFKMSFCVIFLQGVEVLNRGASAKKWCTFAVARPSVQHVQL